MFNTVGKEIFEDRYANGHTVKEAMMQIADYVYPRDNEAWDTIMWLLEEKLFVPAGRIWRTAQVTEGTKSNTPYNCFVIPIKEDSRKGIMKALADQTEIMAHGGGVGINISILRPKDAEIKKVVGKSSGAVSWAELYSNVTGLIMQGGTRRGALMLTMGIWHPDIIEFITVKKNNSVFTNANLSVLITDAFMEAVKYNHDWTLSFPDTSHYLYDTEWNGDLDIWKRKGFPVIDYKTVKARDLWKIIVTSAWESGEPGVLFWDTANYYNPVWYKGHLLSTNPCGEQPLPAYGVCNLGHINLSEMYDSYEGVNWELLETTVREGVRFLDAIIDRADSVLPEVDDRQKKDRRIGLGVLGLHDLLIKNALVYGSPEAVVFTATLFDNIMNIAYMESARLAQEYGTFPNYSELHLDGAFMDKLDSSTIAMIKQFGLRNATVLSIAPTGTVGTMYNVSTGIEPHFMYSYQRNSRIGTYTITPEIVDFVNEYPTEGRKKAMVSAMDDISVDDHIAMLATVAYYIDSAVSKTINLPAEATIQDVSKVYFELWSKQVKGATVYRDKSRNEQVLEKKEACPICGNGLIFEDGCKKCYSCGYSVCSI